MPATAQLVIALSAALFIVHGWLMLGHRQRMGTAAGDKPQDPLYKHIYEYLVFGGILVLQFFASWRRVLLEEGTWSPGAVPGGFIAELLPIPANALTLAAGTAVFAAGLALRVWAIRILGRLFTFEIGIRQEHQIIQAGPYRWIRHPSYTGYLLMLIGIGLALASSSFLAITLPGTLFFFLLRIAHEERMLARHFGEPYRDYSRRTSRLVPYVF